MPINETCVPPELLNPKEINCSKYPMAFRDHKYNTPVKVAHAIQLGFDADSLEIHLNEINDVVDYFFHFGGHETTLLGNEEATFIVRAYFATTLCKI